MGPRPVHPLVARQQMSVQRKSRLRAGRKMMTLDYLSLFFLMLARTLRIGGSSSVSQVILWM